MFPLSNRPAHDRAIIWVVGLCWLFDVLYLERLLFYAPLALRAVPHFALKLSIVLAFTQSGMLPYSSSVLTL